METLNTINKIISQELWFDFEVKSYDGFTLIIIGGTDLYYNWLIEITFNDVSFLTLKSDWKKHNKLRAFEIIEGEKNSFIKNLFYVEDGNYIFGLNHDDANADNSNQYVVVAKKIDFKLNV